MSTESAKLLAAIDGLAEALPGDAIASLANAIADVPPRAWPLLSTAAQQVLPVPNYRAGLWSALTHRLPVLGARHRPTSDADCQGALRLPGALRHPL
jgi:hypothetical protein